jgi:Uma2 family endonuclease
MTLPVESRRYTVEEYLRQEADSIDRHEFHDGEVVAMAGGTYTHSRINTNVLVALGIRLRGNPCKPLDGNMRIRIPNKLRYLYADATVICGHPEFDPLDKTRTTITNPKVVIEVLSDSTESYDRGGKFDLYREIPTLEEYVLVSQHQALMESFLQRPDGTWLFSPVKGPQSSLALQSLNIVLPLAEIYEGVEFTEPQDVNQTLS